MSKELAEITIPPVEIRTLIGKTAIYVNKNGVAFENKIKTKEANTPKFFFLNPKDPYHAYYQYVLKIIKNTGKPPVIENDDAKSIINTNIETNNVENAEINKPSDYNFLQFEEYKLVYPESKISVLDLKIIKTVAQFAVINGPEITKEFKNSALSNTRLASQFQFLKDNHSMNKIFKKYFDIYQLIWKQKHDLVEQYCKTTKVYDLLKNCFARAQYLEKEASDVKKVEEKKLMEQITYGSIDWQDFVIVETIEFTELDEVSELNVPLVKADLEYRSLLQKGNSTIFSQIEEVSRLKEEMNDYEKEEVVEDYEGDEIEGEDDNGQMPQYQDDQESDSESDKRNEKIEKELEPVRSVKKIPKGMKVKAAGESRLLKRKYGQQRENEALIDPVTKEKLLRCPLTDKLIPEGKFRTHISTLLRDPKYEEEKIRYESKFKYGTNLTTQQVYENIQRLFDDNSSNSKKSKK